MVIKKYWLSVDLKTFPVNLKPVRKLNCVSQLNIVYVYLKVILP